MESAKIRAFEGRDCRKTMSSLHPPPLPRSPQPHQTYAPSSVLAAADFENVADTRSTFLRKLITEGLAGKIYFITAFNRFSYRISVSRRRTGAKLSRKLKFAKLISVFEFHYYLSPRFSRHLSTPVTYNSPLHRIIGILLSSFPPSCSVFSSSPPNSSR